MPKVSVIIPVYNGEPYLRQCLDSVRAQTLEDIEIICVDDGSTDASWQILEEYREKDPRFRLFQQKNLHAAEARNNGLARAEGKYVIFWDCDDFFEPCALERLYLRAEETGAEICVCDYDQYDHQAGKRYPKGTLPAFKAVLERDTFNRLTNPEEILSFTEVVIWTKLFRRTFLLEQEIKFPDYRYGHDVPFTLVALCSASKITTVNEVLVHYRWNNPESLMGESSRLSLAPPERIRALEFAVDQLIERDIVPTEDLGRKTLQTVKGAFQFTVTEADFMNVYRMCVEGNPSLLQKCRIEERDPGYYSNASDEELVKHLLHDQPGDLLAFFMHDLWEKNRVNAADKRRLRAELKEMRAERKSLKAERKALKAELKAVKAELKTTKSKLIGTKKTLAAVQNSKSYRLGRLLLLIPRKLRDLFRRVK